MLHVCIEEMIQQTREIVSLQTYCVDVKIKVSSKIPAASDFTTSNGFVGKLENRWEFSTEIEGTLKGALVYEYKLAVSEKKDL